MRQKYFIDYAPSLIIIDNLLIFIIKDNKNLTAQLEKYRHICSDIEPIIEQLQAGEILGDQIPRTEFMLYKLRVRNSDVQKGKSGGYRLIYCIQDTDQIILASVGCISEASYTNPIILDKKRWLLASVGCISEASCTMTMNHTIIDPSFWFGWMTLRLSTLRSLQGMLIRRD